VDAASLHLSSPEQSGKPPGTAVSPISLGRFVEHRASAFFPSDVPQLLLLIKGLAFFLLHNDENRRKLRFYGRFF